MPPPDACEITTPGRATDGAHVLVVYHSLAGVTDGFVTPFLRVRYMEIGAVYVLTPRLRGIYHFKCWLGCTYSRMV